MEAPRRLYESSSRNLVPRRWNEGDIDAGLAGREPGGAVLTRIHVSTSTHCAHRPLRRSLRGARRTGSPSLIEETDVDASQRSSIITSLGVARRGDYTVPSTGRTDSKKYTKADDRRPAPLIPVTPTYGPLATVRDSAEPRSRRAATRCLWAKKSSSMRKRKRPA